MSKETNQEQKFKKQKNDNICFTNLNRKNKGKIPILSFQRQLDGEKQTHKTVDYSNNNKYPYLDSCI